MKMMVTTSVLDLGKVKQQTPSMNCLCWMDTCYVYFYVSCCSGLGSNLAPFIFVGHLTLFCVVAR